jgi:tetratricopeptide (TPR) repeat protein
MSEMLANQYLMIKKYSLAKEEYEKLISENEFDFRILKRLLICYVVAFELEKALNLFHKFIKNNPAKIVSSKMSDDDNLCAEIISSILNGEIKFDNERDKNIGLGILYSFCNKSQSKKYFSKVSTKQNCPTVTQIIHRLAKINQAFNNS